MALRVEFYLGRQRRTRGEHPLVDEDDTAMRLLLLKSAKDIDE
jgi:hypothetical protein